MDVEPERERMTARAGNLDLQSSQWAVCVRPAAAGAQIFLATLKGEVLQLEPT
jgi:hypothetical protein